MKILYIAHIRLPTERAHGLQIMQTCAAFSEAGHEVTLAISARNSLGENEIFSYYGLKKTFSVQKVSSFKLSSHEGIDFFIRSLVFALRVLPLIRSRKYDVVYTRDEQLVGRRGVFYEMHDVRKGYFQRRALRKAAGVVVITRGLADYCLKDGVPKDKILVAPDGVDLKKFNIFETKEICRKKTNLPLDKQIVLYAGHLYPWKGVHVLAEAAGLLPDDVRVVLVGGNDREIETLRKNFGSNHRLMIEGRKPHNLIPYYLKAADVLVLPNSAKEDISRLYTSPLKLFEYMASGTALVASDLPSLREILDESNATFVPADDARALARQIEGLLASPVLARHRAEKARKDAGQYSWKNRAAHIVSFIQGLRTLKDTVFYNEASETYSARRYPVKSIDYNHFFFKRRLDVVISQLAKIVPTLSRPSLLEVGCADGVVLRRIYETFGSAISTYRGVDIAPRMIEVARKHHVDTSLHFSLRNPEECFDTADIIVEIGVLNYADFEKEMECVAAGLLPGRYYICSVAGRGSLWDRLVRVDKKFGNFLHYDEYEAQIRSKFRVVCSLPVGLRLPFLWRLPFVARLIQPLIEVCLSPIAPGLFHEKVYVLMRPRV